MTSNTNLCFFLSAILGFLLWGIFPIYFKLLDRVSPWEIVCHRIIWSFFLVGGYILASGSQYKLRQILADKKEIFLLGLAGLLITTNWLTYVYSVLNGYVLEVSLAYFISPLFTIIIGIVFLKEKATPYKVVGVSLCVLALIIKIAFEQSLSLYAIIIASSFSIYSVVKKKVSHSSVTTFFIEVSYLFLPTLGYLVFLQQNGALSFSLRLETINFLLIGLGVISTVPLILFSYAVKNVDLSIMGFLQYISPFIIFFLATFHYEEKVSRVDMIVFFLIWSSIALISYGRMKRIIKNILYNFK